MNLMNICPLCKEGTLSALNEGALLDMTHPPYEWYIQKYTCSHCQAIIEYRAEITSSYMNTYEAGTVQYAPANYSYWHDGTQVYPLPGAVIE